MPQDAPLLDGLLERADGTGIGGWAREPGAPDRAVALDVMLDGIVAVRIEATQFRKDLETSGIGPHAFSLRFPPGLRAREVGVVDAASGRHLPGSPMALPPAPEDDPAATLVAAALAAAESRDAAEALAADLADRLAASLARPDPRQALLLARWGHAPETETMPRRALVLDMAVPDTARDAGSNAVLSHMLSLRRLGYSVEFASAYSLARTQAHAAIEALGITPWHAPWAASIEEVLAASGPGLDLVYIHRLPVMRRYAALVRDWCPNARLVYCVADLHHLRAARRHALETGVSLEAALATRPIAALRAQELAACAAADAVIVHSEAEATRLAAEAPAAAVHVLPWHVPPAPATTPWAERRGVTFLGSYGHAPNLDAAQMLLDAVMPIVWETAPDLPLYLAGSDMPASLAAHAAPRVEILGHVADLATLWNRVRLTAAPLRFGAGLKGKILTSLAAGVPCVTTPIGAEGIPPEALAQCIADDPAGLASAILRLHEDEAAHREASRAGLAYVGARLSEAAIDAAMRDVCNQAPAPKHPTRPPANV